MGALLASPVACARMKGGRIAMSTTFDIAADEVPVFLAEAEEQLQILDEGLVRLERAEQDPGLLQGLFRAAHTLKGSAGMIGHRRMVEVTHALEAVFDGLRKGQRPLGEDWIDACLEAVDALRTLCEEVPQGLPSGVDIHPLVQRLLNLVPNRPALVAGASPQATSLPKEGQSTLDAAAITIQATISPDSAASAARAFQIMLALQEMGEIISMQPDQATIETAAPVHQFTVRFTPACPLDEVRAALAAISDIESLSIGDEEIILNQRPITHPLTESRRPMGTPTAKGQGRENRLGKILVEHGLISEAQLQAAIQEQERASGPTPLLGQVLVRMGMITQEVLDEVLAEQKEERQKAQPATDLSAVEPGRPRASEKTVRTSVERLDNLMNLVGELITDRNRLNLIRNNLSARFGGEESIAELSETIAHLGRITDQLQAEVMGIRMLPISNLFNRFPRLVRDLARQAGKQIDLVVRGEETELDRSVIEVISDPLIHLLRNAVDHGIEPPQERLAAGKTERGIILLTARHEQGRIVITVEDDGRGIDVERVKAKAIEKGLISKAEAEAMSLDEALELIFVPGLSTARTVSDVSGRGVGMDIVRNNIESLNGSVQVQTWPGRGTQFQITLPLTLAIVPSLLVQVGAGTFAIPLVAVSEILRLPRSEIQSVNGRPVILLRERVVSVVSLAQVFNFQDKANGRRQEGMVYIVVVHSAKTQMGLIIDDLIGEEEVVVKSLHAFLGNIPGISAAAILGDGRVALILDVQGLFKWIMHDNATSRGCSGRICDPAAFDL